MSLETITMTNNQSQNPTAPDFGNFGDLSVSVESWADDDTESVTSCTNSVVSGDQFSEPEFESVTSPRSDRSTSWSVPETTELVQEVTEESQSDTEWPELTPRNQALNPQPPSQIPIDHQVKTQSHRLTQPLIRPKSYASCQDCGTRFWLRPHGQFYLVWPHQVLDQPLDQYAVVQNLENRRWMFQSQHCHQCQAEKLKAQQRKLASNRFALMDFDLSLGSKVQGHPDLLIFQEPRRAQGPKMSHRGQRKFHPRSSQPLPTIPEQEQVTIPEKATIPEQEQVTISEKATIPEQEQVTFQEKVTVTCGSCHSVMEILEKTPLWTRVRKSHHSPYYIKWRDCYHCHQANYQRRVKRGEPVNQPKCFGHPNLGSPADLNC